MSVRRTRKDDGSQWTVADSRSVYGIRHWGAGYFAINEAGRVEVRPNGPNSSPIDLYEQVDELRKNSGLSLPLLVRFPDILQDRVRQLTGAFDANIERLEYQSKYTALYPIKVNQQEAVIENIIATKDVSIGLEAGSKPELLAVLALAPKGGEGCGFFGHRQSSRWRTKNWPVQGAGAPWDTDREAPLWQGQRNSDGNAA